MGVRRGAGVEGGGGVVPTAGGGGGRDSIRVLETRHPPSVRCPPSLG